MLQQMRGDAFLQTMHVCVASDTHMNQYFIGQYDDVRYDDTPPFFGPKAISNGQINGLSYRRIDNPPAEPFEMAFGPTKMRDITWGYFRKT